MAVALLQIQPVLLPKIARRAIDWVVVPVYSLVRNTLYTVRPYALAVKTGLRVDGVPVSGEVPLTERMLRLPMSSVVVLWPLSWPM